MKEKISKQEKMVRDFLVSFIIKLDMGVSVVAAREETKIQARIARKEGVINSRLYNTIIKRSQSWS